nr:hypothetical protein CFP56_28631 [Quercus suber]
MVTRATRGFGNTVMASDVGITLPMGRSRRPWHRHWGWGEHKSAAVGQRASAAGIRMKDVGLVLRRRLPPWCCRIHEWHAGQRQAGQREGRAHMVECGKGGGGWTGAVCARTRCERGTEDKVKVALVAQMSNHQHDATKPCRRRPGGDQGMFRAKHVSDIVRGRWRAWVDIKFSRAVVPRPPPRQFTTFSRPKMGQCCRCWVLSRRTVAARPVCVMISGQDSGFRIAEGDVVGSLPSYPVPSQWDEQDI